VAGCCEHRNEPSAPENVGNFLPKLELLTYEGGLCSLELAVGVHTFMAECQFPYIYGKM
jgi:hypothetical protein